VLLQPALAQDPRFAGNAQRTAHREALQALIVEAFSTLTADAVGVRLEAAQIAHAQVKDMAGLWAHPQLQARGRWREVETSAGSVATLLPPGSWDDGDPRLDAVPALGQHTAAILAELGVGADEITALRAAEAI
jgi:crotonobetainyl-CoA:carnitine CoA-transferase CaiB-like acyl-CoA transferase